jgi:hypothetical protein
VQILRSISSRYSMSASLTSSLRGSHRPDFPLLADSSRRRREEYERGVNDAHLNQTFQADVKNDLRVLYRERLIKSIELLVALSTVELRYSPRPVTFASPTNNVLHH